MLLKPKNPKRMPTAFMAFLKRNADFNFDEHTTYLVQRSVWVQPANYKRLHDLLGNKLPLKKPSMHTLHRDQTSENMLL